MTETTNGPDDAATISSRDWVRAAVWIGVMLAIGIIALIVFYNMMLCGCGTRPAG